MQRSFSESPANTELYKAVTEICIAPEVLDELWIIVLWICLKCISLTSDTDNNRIQLRQDHRMRETCFEAATLPYFIFCDNSTACLPWENSRIFHWSTIETEKSDHLVALTYDPRTFLFLRNFALIRDNVIPFSLWIQLFSLWTFLV